MAWQNGLNTRGTGPEVRLSKIGFLPESLQESRQDVVVRARRARCRTVLDPWTYNRAVARKRVGWVTFELKYEFNAIRTWMLVLGGIRSATYL